MPNRPTPEQLPAPIGDPPPPKPEPPPIPEPKPIQFPPPTISMGKEAAAGVPGAGLSGVIRSGGSN